MNALANRYRLFEEAQDKGLIGGSESERLTFVATAERARMRAERNAEGLFAALVSRRLWHFVTQDDEDRAHVRLREHFHGWQEAGEMMKSPSRALSRDALFVADVTAKLRQKGFVGNVFSAVSLHLPDWTRERWEAARCELKDAKKDRAGNMMGCVAIFV